MRNLSRVVVAVVLAVGARSASAATNAVALAEVLASWQGNDRVQFIELAFTGDTTGNVSGASVVIDGPTGKASERHTVTLTSNVPIGTRGARVLLASNGAADLSGFPTPDAVLPNDVLNPDGGRVCFVVPDAFGDDGEVDCVAYGSFTGKNGDFGRPLRGTPDNRAIFRTDTTGVNRNDWDTALEPTPQNNAGRLTTLETLCGDGTINQGESCDGTVLGGNTCTDLGFAKGKLKCFECHFDTSGCSFCGNDEINKGEQCDGSNLNDTTCADLGFTGGELFCNSKCTFGTDQCDDTFFVPGGGPTGPECFSEWRVRNGTGRPTGDGTASNRQKCKDGDITCDNDTVPGQCSFQVSVCFNRDDERLATSATKRCKRAPIGFWQLKSSSTQPGQDLLDAVNALAPSGNANGIITFGPALPATEQCTATQTIVVARGAQVRLKSRTVAEGGRPRDVDALRLSCVP